MSDIPEPQLAYCPNCGDPEHRKPTATCDLEAMTPGAAAYVDAMRKVGTDQDVADAEAAARRQSPLPDFARRDEDADEFRRRHLGEFPAQRHVVVYGPIIDRNGDKRSGREEAERVAHRIAQRYKLERRPTLIHDEAGTRGMRQPTVYLVGYIDDRLRDALKVCEAVLPNGERY